jgi:hypothetical protein
MTGVFWKGLAQNHWPVTCILGVVSVMRSDLLHSRRVTALLIEIQVFNGQPPFCELSVYRAILAIVNGHEHSRPNVPELDDKMWDLMVRCWDQRPSHRPTASEVVETLTLWSMTRCTPRSMPAVDWDQDVLSCLHSTLLQRPSVKGVSRF